MGSFLKGIFMIVMIEVMRLAEGIGSWSAIGEGVLKWLFSSICGGLCCGWCVSKPIECCLLPTKIMVGMPVFVIIIIGKICSFPCSIPGMCIGRIIGGVLGKYIFRSAGKI
ncbi:MAG: hypothetical protein MOIL_00747 [Candidatus Methanolliviera sp. GoM_oil]|nr:MAG: hypothetical protein MOIL_00747 [Candidatus Methanolliviera sp. GoM_oil]